MKELIGQLSQRLKIYGKLNTPAKDTGGKLKEIDLRSMYDVTQMDMSEQDFEYKEYVEN